MRITANSFSLRGENGVVSIVSDSAFSPETDRFAYSTEAECDVIIESDGFSVSKAVTLGMPGLNAFLCDLKRVLRERSGTATFKDARGDLTLKYVADSAEHRVECEMDDRNEGKENCIKVKYPIEADYLRELAEELAEELADPVRGARAS